MHDKCMAVFLASWLSMAAISAEEEGPSVPASELQALRMEIELLRKQFGEQQMEHETQLSRLQRQIDDLSQAQEELVLVPDAMLDGAFAGAEYPPPSGLAGTDRSWQSMNPEISVNTDFLFHYDSREGVMLDDEFLLREVELGLSGYIDPFARADIFLGIHRAHAHGDEGHDEHEEEPDDAHGTWELHVEEAYLTLLTLPWDLQAKVGKFKASFGKVNPMHRHALPWVDYPLVVRTFFGHGGLTGTGLSLSRLISNPWDHYIEVTGEVFNNDSRSLFAGEEADDFVALLHLKDFLELSDSSDLELGLSLATGPNDDGHGSSRTCVEGLDLTYRWRPIQEGLYKSFMWQTEVFAAQKDLSDGREGLMGPVLGPRAPV